MSGSEELLVVGSGTSGEEEDATPPLGGGLGEADGAGQAREPKSTEELLQLCWKIILVIFILHMHSDIDGQLFQPCECDRRPTRVRAPRSSARTRSVLRAAAPLTPARCCSPAQFSTRASSAAAWTAGRCWTTSWATARTRSTSA